MSASGAPINREGSPLHDKKLVGWKEIAVYLGREIRTVQRWERTEGLPVHRHEHQKRSTVYAYASELDEWFKRRQPKDDPEADAAFEPDAADADLSPPEPLPTGTDEARKQRTRFGKWLGVAVLGGSLIALLSLGYLATRSSFFRPNRKVRLVVIPFTNLSGDPKQDYFSAGLTDEMITRLGNLDPQHLGVIAATSSNVLAGKPIAEIGHALDVQYALEGSVRRDANRVRIDVQLIQVSDQTHLWADSFDRDLNDILRVQDDVGTAVAASILFTLKPSPAKAGEAAAKRTVNPDAYDAYLRGRFYWINRGDLHKSIEAYQEALEKDPQYALAYAGLAAATAILGQVPNDGLAPRDAKPKAREAAQHALQLDPRLADAHAVLGNVAMSYDWDLAAAEKELQQSIALNPNDPTAHQWYGHLLIVEGRNAEALNEDRRALDLDPANPLFPTSLAEVYYFARNYDAAIEQGQRALQLRPDFPLAQFWLGSAYREKKMYPQAVQTFERARQVTGDNPAMVMAYGHAQAVAGNVLEARKALRKLEQLRSTRYVPDLYLAAIHVGLGEKDEAFRLLDSAYEQRVDRLVYLKFEPMADPLRSDPRFADLLKKIGIQ